LRGGEGLLTEKGRIATYRAVMNILPVKRFLVESTVTEEAGVVYSVL
jgi:hypothetical protein